MSLQPLPAENVQPTAQNLLAFLDREDVNVPGNMLEAIVSGKSLLRALLNGQLVICRNAPDAEGAPPGAEPVKAEDLPVPPAASKKKRSKKKAA